jgi:hypothetical protein
MEGEELGAIFGEGVLRRVWKVRTLMKRSAGAMIKAERSASLERIGQIVFLNK